MTTDLVLLRRYHEHADAFAFRELVQAHAGMVFATARRVTRDPALAEDVAQETFLELARHAPSIRESVAAWLHRVAWRRACNAVRDASARRRYEAVAAADDAEQERHEASWEELEPMIDAALDELPEKLRAPLVEHFLEGRTQQEIAARLAVSQPTISRQLDAGIDRLRAQLRQKGLAVGGSLAMFVAAHAVTPAPPALVTSLGKLAVSGVGGSAAANMAGAVAALASRAALVRWWRYIVVGAAGVIAIASWLLLGSARSSDLAGAAVTAAEVTPAAEVHEWQGRAFCPMCALPNTGGREPEHGIFVHVEDGREVVYDLALPQPIPDFHARLCVPSMNDVHAAQVRGTIQRRDGRLALAVTMLEPRLR